MSVFTILKVSSNRDSDKLRKMKKINIYVFIIIMTYWHLSYDIKLISIIVVNTKVVVWHQHFSIL